MKTWACEICHQNVSEIGAYAKLTTTKYAHLSCWQDFYKRAGIAEYLKVQQEATARAEQERQVRECAKRERVQEVQERERTNRIQAALNNPLPPKVEPVKKTLEPEKPRPDRFDLIDIK